MHSTKPKQDRDRKEGMLKSKDSLDNDKILPMWVVMPYE